MGPNSDGALREMLTTILRNLCFDLSRRTCVNDGMVRNRSAGLAPIIMVVPPSWGRRHPCLMLGSHLFVVGTDICCRHQCLRVALRNRCEGQSSSLTPLNLTLLRTHFISCVAPENILPAGDHLHRTRSVSIQDSPQDSTHSEGALGCLCAGGGYSREARSTHTQWEMFKGSPSLR